MFGFILTLVISGVFSQSVAAGGSLQDAQVSHGKYIATIAGCTSCHTPLKAEYQNPQSLKLEQIQTLAFDEHSAHDTDKLLAGGRAFDLGPAGMVFTRNITPDKETGIGAWTDEQIKAAIKTGQTPSNEILFPVMPYHVYNGMADSDVDAVVAYLRSVNAVNYKAPKDTVSTAGLSALPYQEGIATPDASDKSARGAYLVNNVMGCTDCHTPIDPATGAPVMEKYLGGGQPYEGPWGIVYGGNITPDKETGLGDWNEEEIKRALVSGLSRDGRRLVLMPWYAYSSLTGEDADAVAYYLKNDLRTVHNEVPAISLNPDFKVMAPEAETQTKPTSGLAAQPVILVIVGVGIILLVTAILLFVRRRSVS